jgi:arabinose-5-phosphate isomerase
LAKLIRKFHSKTWLLTCNKFAKTKKKVDNTLVFNLQQEGDPWNILPNNSTSLFLIFLQSLTMALIEKKNISIKVVKRNHPGGSIGEKLKKK